MSQYKPSSLYYIQNIISILLLKEHNDDEKYWDSMVKDIEKFMEEDHPEEEKRRLTPLLFGIEASGWTTSNHRGFWCDYSRDTI